MNFGKVSSCEKLQKVIAALNAAGQHGATTAQIREMSGVEAASTRISELRANGYEIECKRQGSVWRYWLRSAPENAPPVVLGE